MFLILKHNLSGSYYETQTEGTTSNRPRFLSVATDEMSRERQSTRSCKYFCFHFFFNRLPNMQMLIAKHFTAACQAENVLNLFKALPKDSAFHLKGL